MGGGVGVSIKPCPFCGSTKTQVIKSIVQNDWSVECMICETIGPSEDGSDTAILSWNEGFKRWKQFFKMKDALEQIGERDWELTLPNYIAIRQIAREALE
jgi:Lar family restriction alleviation protein